MSPATKHRPLLRPACIMAVLAVAIFAVYGQLRGSEFLNFDDDLYVLTNAEVTGGVTWHGIVWAFTTVDFFYWQPLTWISHMLDCQLFGLRAGWHHMSNVWLHFVNSVLVFLVFRRLTGAEWRSAILAGLFALHPLRVESVAWIAERKDVLSCFWFLIATWTYIRYAEQPSDKRFRLVMLAMLMGLMSKPMLVTVPLIFLLLDYWPLRRVAIKEKIPMVFLAAIASLLTAIGAKREGALEWGYALSFTAKLSNALYSYVKYLGKTVWPVQLSIFYPHPISFSKWQVAGSVLVLVAISVGALWFGRRHRFLAVGWLWFLVGLFPTIGMMQVGWQGMADRFVYIPLIGIFLVVVWGGEILLRERPRTAAALAITVLAVAGARSWVQVGTWRDSITVFSHALEVQESVVAHRYLGAALFERGDTGAALPHFARTVEMMPAWFIAHNDYGLALLDQGDAAAAAEQFRESIRHRKTYGDAYFGLAKAMLRLGRPDEARATVDEALKVGMTARNVAPASALLAQISGPESTH